MLVHFTHTVKGNTFFNTFLKSSLAKQSHLPALLTLKTAEYSKEINTLRVFRVILQHIILKTHFGFEVVRFEVCVLPLPTFNHIFGQLCFLFNN